MKTCKSCLNDKPETEFHWNKKATQSRVAQCKSCVSRKLKTYYQANREIIQQKTKEYYFENKDTCLQSRKLYAQTNKRLMNEIGKTYRTNHHDVVLKRGKQYRLLNKDKAAAYSAARRAAKLQQCPKWITSAQKEEMKQLYAVASLTGKHVDHIIPLKGKLVRGLHVPWNLQLLTPEENLQKSNHFAE